VTGDRVDDDHGDKVSTGQCLEDDHDERSDDGDRLGVFARHSCRDSLPRMSDIVLLPVVEPLSRGMVVP
jgi:hypothetical protein